MPCDVEKKWYVFDHAVKPVVLYALEIVGMFKLSSNDNLFEKTYKYFLPVSKKTNKLALYRELDNYPMYIDVVSFVLNN